MLSCAPGVGDEREVFGLSFGAVGRILEGELGIFWATWDSSTATRLVCSGFMDGFCSLGTLAAGGGLKNDKSVRCAIAGWVAFWVAFALGSFSFEAIPIEMRDYSIQTPKKSRVRPLKQKMYCSQVWRKNHTFSQSNSHLGNWAVQTFSFSNSAGSSFRISCWRDCHLPIWLGVHGQAWTLLRETIAAIRQQQQNPHLRYYEINQKIYFNSIFLRFIITFYASSDHICGSLLGNERWPIISAPPLSSCQHYLLRWSWKFCQPTIRNAKKTY